jgi:HPt (histidine-containing phosphotransfer) domain-containing protein
LSEPKQVEPTGRDDRRTVPLIDEGVLAALVEDIGLEQLPVALGLFVDEMGRRADDLRRAAEGLDAEQLRRIAHGARGSASTFGAPAVTAAARRLEEACKSGEPATGLPALIEVLLVEMAGASGEVRKRIESLQGSRNG